MTIIFTGGEHPSKEHAIRFLKSIKIKKTPFIIVADSGLPFCTECGFTPNIICGDFDSLTEITTIKNLENQNSLEIKDIPSYLHKKYPQAIIHQWPKDKDYTDTQIALQEASTSDCIILVGGDGMRPDHFFANLKLFEQQPAPDFWLCKQQYVKHLKENTSHTIKNNEEFSIFPILNMKKQDFLIQSKNLVWELNDVNWEKSLYSLSNRRKKSVEDATISVLKGNFLLLMPYALQ